jgi:hypothetical protein
MLKALKKFQKAEVQSIGSFSAPALRNNFLENTSETEFQKRFKQHVTESSVRGET